VKKKDIFKSLFIAVILISLTAVPSFSLTINNEINQTSTDIFSSDISGDIKARIPGSDWQDTSLTADTGTKLNFKIDITSSGGGIVVAVLIPYINEEPMLSYVLGSSSNIPFFIDETAVMWGFSGGAPAQLTFDLKVLKSGYGDVQSSVCDVVNEDSDDDSIQIVGQGGCCFPAGTKITMADGSCKNIEDVKIGDKVLSYDFESKEYSSWFVKMLGRPKHPIYSINDGLLKLTSDHPIFVKRSEKVQGPGLIDDSRTKNSIVFKDDAIQLEIGDYLLDSKGNFIKVFSIEKSNEYVQTYNILSFSGARSYFANGVLVYEEHPPNSFTSQFLETILEKMPKLTQFLLTRPFFQRIFSP
jgi:hypothetical protein